MRTNTNEINIHLLLSNDINRLREAGTRKHLFFFFSLFQFNEFTLALSKLLKLTQQNCNHDTMHNHETM